MRFLPLFLLACSIDDPNNGNACTDIAFASVSLSVVDDGGVAVADAEATFTVDGGETQICENLGGGSYACGWEQAGNIVVTVAKEGYESATETVEVGMTDDGCHVEGQVLELTLEEKACTAEVITSVLATLSGSSGETLESPEVSWGYADADMEPVPCESGDGVTWACGEDVNGDLEIYGTASGHTTDLEPVTVPLDEAGCHAVTQSVDLVVEWLPD